MFVNDIVVILTLGYPLKTHEQFFFEIFRNLRVKNSKMELLWLDFEEPEMLSKL